MTQHSLIELFKEDMKFTAGHFTIFSATERENLHGHNYQVHIALLVEVSHNGMAFDYRHYQKIIRELCQQLNQSTLLPTQSPYLQIEEDNQYYRAYFNNECMPFLKRDIKLLPVDNITVEELSRWFIEQITQDVATLRLHQIKEITIKISNSPGQYGSCQWRSC